MYPKWMYTSHDVAQHYGDLVTDLFIGRVINSEDELKALGGKWYGTPRELLLAEVDQEINEAITHSLSVEREDDASTLKARLDDKGIAYDNRWGVKKLKAALEG